MNLINVLGKNVRQIERYLIHQSPTILTALGVSGVLTTTVLAVRVTPRALFLIDRENHLRRGDDLTKLEVIKLVWKLYVPAGISAASTIACIIGANSIHLRRNAALVSLYTITEHSLKEYQEKVIELMGKNKEGKIRDELAQDRLNDNPVEKRDVIITGMGETLFYDSLSGRYFKSSMEEIRRIQNDFNKELFKEMYKPLNDFYDMLKLEGIEIGRDSGWEVDELLDIYFSAKIATNGVPAIVMEYKNGPKPL